MKPAPIGHFVGFSLRAVFSYIVFQHIPSHAAIANYIREAARVLRPDGAFKVQLNGDQSPAYLAHERDTWLGETFSPDEAQRIVTDAGLTLVATEGMGTQYFMLTCRKRGWRQPLPSPYILPGEPWAEAQVREGWGAPVAASWRPIAARSRAVLAVPRGWPLRFFLGLYFWPDQGTASHTVQVTLAGLRIGTTVFECPGDQYLEFEVPVHLEGVTEIVIDIAPSCDAPVRALGLYVPSIRACLPESWD